MANGPEKELRHEGGSSFMFCQAPSFVHALDEVVGELECFSNLINCPPVFDAPKDEVKHIIISTKFIPRLLVRPEIR